MAVNEKILAREGEKIKNGEGHGIGSDHDSVYSVNEVKVCGVGGGGRRGRRMHTALSI